MQQTAVLLTGYRKNIQEKQLYSVVAVRKLYKMYAIVSRVWISSAGFRVFCYIFILVLLFFGQTSFSTSFATDLSKKILLTSTFSVKTIVHNIFTFIFLLLWQLLFGCQKLCFKMSAISVLYVPFQFFNAFRMRYIVFINARFIREYLLLIQFLLHKRSYSCQKLIA